MSSDVIDVLLRGEKLQALRERVVAEGCEVSPDVANKAKLFVPLSPEELEHLDLNLRQHHVVAFRDDIPIIELALESIACKRRPKLRNEKKINDADAPGESSAGLAEGMEPRD